MVFIFKDKHLSLNTLGFKIHQSQLAPRLILPTDVIYLILNNINYG